jgi:hypothetical protein
MSRHHLQDSISPSWNDPKLPVAGVHGSNEAIRVDGWPYTCCGDGYGRGYRHDTRCSYGEIAKWLVLACQRPRESIAQSFQKRDESSGPHGTPTGVPYKISVNGSWGCRGLATSIVERGSLGDTGATLNVVVLAHPQRERPGQAPDSKSKGTVSVVGR